jgi:hypothetical protein
MEMNILIDKNQLPQNTIPLIVRFVLEITSHIVGKDGFSMTYVWIAPSTHLWMSFAQTNAYDLMNPHKL